MERLPTRVATGPAPVAAGRGKGTAQAQREAA
jgi:hypothetical protein